jgi:EAL domain-containing protein (putative c-di-GMP-specific phosphodiesterase class I)
MASGSRRRRRIDVLKIDRPFVRDFERSPDDREVVQVILNIASKQHQAMS